MANSEIAINLFTEAKLEQVFIELFENEDYPHFLGNQTNLDQKVKVTSKGVKKTFGFAKFLHDSLPNATFVGFAGTPIDVTLDVL